MVLAAYLAGVGALILLGAAALGWSRLRLWREGTRVMGVVADYRTRLRSRPGEPVSRMPVVAFEAAGVRRAVQSRMSADPAKLPLGAPVPIVYLPSRPERAEIDTPLRLWTAPAALAVMGGVLMFGAGRAAGAL